LLDPELVELVVVLAVQQVGLWVALGVNEVAAAQKQLQLLKKAVWKDG
jgi:hypothetical protein